MNQISIGKIEYTLTAFQNELWHAIDENRLIGISAPTSAGKSFLIYLKIIDMIKNGFYRFVYVVPTLSLISQVTSDLSKLLKAHGFSDIDILNSYEEQLEKFIYVVTQERAIILFSENGINELDLLVVDEVQNIEKVANEGEDRSKILYDVLIDVRNDTNVGKIILSGPRLKNIGGLGFRIFGKVSDEKQTDSSPVLNITYSISERNGEYYLKLYSTIFEHPIEKQITNTEHINGLGQVKYTPKFNEYLHRTLAHLPNEVNIIFSPTSAQARKSAENFFKTIPKLNCAKLHSLSDYFKSSVHKRYSLANFVESGIAYHTGKTPMHVRKSLEHATSSELINYLFCTTTLMQGVNLPAKNIIIRNPYLFTKRSQDSIKLSAYEFANLRGRAGRLLTDFIGRTIVLDESSFNDTDKSNDSALFSDEYKDINTGYQGIYEQNSYFIDNALETDSLISDAPSKGLITHIRQMIYRHGNIGGSSRLKDVGVNLHSDLINKVALELNSLHIPRDIILSNRYWDPMDLEPRIQLR
ncbi:DEAD/DEAH box helicase, partial [Aeromonas rivipollensis]|uniref:DEAD/DEAH box helicase n=1 Tax=Aeromonas rivipollensis TaxID=948519 RepID=UPI001F45E7A5